ncbi:MAG: flagellar biosynthesis anti-sigma factor FlgM [Ectothiorhodospiraceae bacterium]|nr:flagellar biosynthesis anti-sigma factor FlgM [Ectothiorhodospiraceae bacterium]MCH8506445.1 flagellar biosynthesis anti-sigma factor FlgM [Ectothiorhodospiraceae bacterium]
MTNPIDGGSRTTTQLATDALRNKQPDAAARGQRGAQTGEQPSAADQASLSERLQAVRERIDNAPDVDMDKVAAIRQSIAEGNYPLDADRIASKFADLEGLLR